VTGEPVARQLSLLLGHHSAVAFRGLTRVEALRDARIRRNPVDDFSADTAWMAAAACAGELHRVPGELYRKRYHAANVHTTWARWPPERRSRAWVVHCADMLEAAMAVEATAGERWLLWLGAVERLGCGGWPAFTWTRDCSLRRNPPPCSTTYSITCAASGRSTCPPCSGAGWRGIRRRTRAVYGRRRARP
jgi:hypothetical protein